MAREEYLSPIWWAEVIRDAFAIIEPIMRETAEKVAAGGYVIGQERPTWEKLLQISEAQGPAYAGELLRRMLINPSTSADAQKLFEKVLQAQATRSLERNPQALQYAGTALGGQG